MTPFPRSPLHELARAMNLENFGKNSQIDIEETEDGVLSEEDKDFIIRKSEDIPDPLS